ELKGGKARILAEYEARVSTADALTHRTDLDFGAPVEAVERERVQIYEGFLRLGGEYRPVESFAVRAGVDEIGAGFMQPSAGFMVQQPVGELLLRAEYAFRLEPFDTQPMHFITLRLYL
ncbi:MAG TPA: hypothetical protein VFG50_14365, partial [Rhodothermales bacterium]|nr:hypothetical protein [Rhodothermales bacterium]